MNTQKIVQFVKNEAVLCAALFLALISMIVVKPDREYLEYIDYRTLALLFCLMSLMAGFQKLGVFSRIGCHAAGDGEKRAAAGCDPGGAVLFSSMVVTNDVALITFVPFALEVLERPWRRTACSPWWPCRPSPPIWEHDHPHRESPESVSILPGGWERGVFAAMLPLPVAFGPAALLFLLCRPSSPLSLPDPARPASPDGRRRASISPPCSCLASRWPGPCLRRCCAYWWPSPALADCRVLFRVDWALLATFVGFFLFVGNLSRLPACHELFPGCPRPPRGGMRCPGASQAISNVPAALLLSGFTKQYRDRPARRHQSGRTGHADRLDGQPDLL